MRLHLITIQTISLALQNIAKYCILVMSQKQKVFL